MKPEDLAPQEARQVATDVWMRVHGVGPYSHKRTRNPLPISSAQVGTEAFDKCLIESEEETENGGTFSNCRLVLPVLDHGYIELLDVMGDELSIVEAARVSYANGTERKRSPRQLIRYLLRKRHTSPFEMIEIKVRVKLPIFVERQWVRHRMASLNEVSARYSELPEEFYVPELEELRGQASKNKQGSEGLAANPEAFHEGYALARAQSFGVYRAGLEGGIAREISRITLPVGIYTEKIWKIDGKNLIDFLGLRCDPHAQEEIRAYAYALADILAGWCPMVYEAAQDYRFTARTISGPEIRALTMAFDLIGKGLKSQTIDDSYVMSTPRQLLIHCLLEQGVPKSETDELLATFGLTEPR